MIKSFVRGSHNPEAAPKEDHHLTNILIELKTK